MKLLTRRRLFWGIPLAAMFTDRGSTTTLPDLSNSRITSPTQFGATGGDGRDHTQAFEKAIQHAAGGALVIPPGIFSVQGNYLTIPPNTSLLGFGRSSVLRRIGDGTLLNVSGKSSRERNGGCLLRDIVLDGNDRRGELIRCHYAHDLIFENVWSRRNFGVALDAVELWDSRFTNCTWDWCSGADGASPSVLLRNQEGATDGGDNTNALYFTNCRWESFRDGALWLSESGPRSISQIHLSNCKMETSYVRGSFLRISRAARNVIVQNLYLCGNSFDRNVSVPVNLVDFSPYGLAKLENVSVWLNAPVARTVIRANVNHASCTIDNVWVDGPHNPTVALLENVGSLRPPITQSGYLNNHPGTKEA